MKRRREIGPKKAKNRPALIRFLILAAVVAIGGGVLTWQVGRLAGPMPSEEQLADGEGLSFWHKMPALMLLITLVATLALVFFGVRAYQIGIKARQSLQSGRMKVRRS